LTTVLYFLTWLCGHGALFGKPRFPPFLDASFGPPAVCRLWHCFVKPCLLFSRSFFRSRWTLVLSLFPFHSRCFVWLPHHQNRTARPHRMHFLPQFPRACYREVTFNVFTPPLLPVLPVVFFLFKIGPPHGLSFPWSLSFFPQSFSDVRFLSFGGAVLR